MEAESKAAEIHQRFAAELAKISRLEAQLQAVEMPDPLRHALDERPLEELLDQALSAMLAGRMLEALRRQRQEFERKGPPERDPREDLGYKTAKRMRAEVLELIGDLGRFRDDEYREARRAWRRLAGYVRDYNCRSWVDRKLSAAGLSWPSFLDADELPPVAA